MTLVLDGKAGAAKKKKATETLESLIKVFKGKLTDSKEWGTKDLAYKIGKSTTGLYLNFTLELAPEGARALIDKIRVDGEIIRYLLIRS